MSTSKKKRKKNDPLLIVACFLGVAVLIAISIILQKYNNASNDTDPGWHMVNNETYYIDAITRRRAVGLNMLSNRPYYFQSDGTVREGWTEYNGNEIYVQANGLVATGECEIDNDIYSFSFDTYGKLTNTFIKKDNGPSYYFGEDGKAVKGIHNIDGDDYYFDENCVLVKGEWFKHSDDDANCYADKDGKVVSGWISLADGTHYFDEDHKAATGKRKIDGVEYTFNSVGLVEKGPSVTTAPKPATTKPQVSTTPETSVTAAETTKPVVKTGEGWREVDGKKQYIYSDGAVATGIQRLEDVLYSFSSSGFLNTGWLELNGNKYFSDENGVVKTGFADIEGKTYHFDNIGKMSKGEFEIGGDKYFAHPSGQIAKREKVEISGNTYYFDEAGKRVKGFKLIDSYTYYFSEAADRLGQMQKGFTAVNDVFYFFDDLGREIVGWQQIGSFRYYFDPKMVTGSKVIDGDTYNFAADGCLLGENDEPQVFDIQ